MYDVWNGGTVGSANVYHLDDAAEMTEEFREWMPFAVFFADDGGDGAYFVDAAGELGSIGAVYWTSRGGLVPAESVPAGDSLTVFLEAAARGYRPSSHKAIRDADLESMVEALARHRDRWTSAAIPSDSEVARAVVFRLGGVPAELPPFCARPARRDSRPRE